MLVGGKRLTSSSTKTNCTVDFKLCTHISHKMMNKNVLLFFHWVIVYCNDSRSFESAFCMKTVKSRLFKKYMIKSLSTLCFSLSWLHGSANEIPRLIKVKQLKQCPTLTFVFPIFRVREKGKLYILRMVGLITSKEIL